MLNGEGLVAVFPKFLCAEILKPPACTTGRGRSRGS
jgi:hypothetical protein